MASIAFVLFFIITISTFASTEKCTNPLPALMQMASGVDITALDLFQIGDSPEQRGLLENVLNLTCSGVKIKDKVWINYDENHFNYFDLPDQISDISLSDSAIQIITTGPTSKWAYVREILLERLHLEYRSNSKELLGAFARSTKYTSLLKQHFGANKAFYDIGERSEDLVLKIDVKEQSILSYDFLDFITHQLPLKYDDNPAAYETFIKRFGTHYFSGAYISNYEYIQFALSQEYMLDTSDDQIDKDLRAANYDYFERYNNYTSNGSSEVVLAYSTRKNGASRWLDKLTSKQYQSSQITGVIIHGAKLSQIEDLIDNKTIKAQVEVAVRMHRIRAQLEELNNIYNFTSDYYQLSNEEKVALGKLKKLVNSGDIKQIDQMVTIVNELYNKAIQFRDNHFMGRIIDDFYVTACTKLEFAKQVCPILAMKHSKEQRPECPSYAIFEAQIETSKLWEDYHKPSNYSKNDDPSRDPYRSALWDTRKLNQRYGLQADMTNGLKASCGDC